MNKIKTVCQDKYRNNDNNIFGESKIGKIAGYDRRPYPTRV